MRPLALRVDRGREAQAEALVAAFCAALVEAGSDDGARVQSMFARRFTWLGQPNAWVELEAFDNVRRVPASILIAIDFDHSGFLFLVDMTRSGRTVTACVEIDESATFVERVFDPEPLVRSISPS